MLEVVRECVEVGVRSDCRGYTRWSNNFSLCPGFFEGVSYVEMAGDGDGDEEWSDWNGWIAYQHNQHRSQIA